MKSIKYLFCALVAMLAVVSCTKETAYEAGPAEAENVIFFPEQETEISLMPDEDMQYGIIVERTGSTELASYEFDILNAGEGVFVFDKKIVFEEGETSTELVVSFPDAAIGAVYSGQIAITNEEYKPTYKNSTYTFSVTRSYTWLPVKGADGSSAASYYGDLAGLMYGIPATRIENLLVEEAKELPGFYRVSMLWAQLCAEYFKDEGFSMEELIEGGNVSDETYFYINASDPEHVFVPYQSTSIILNPDDGTLEIASFIDAFFGAGETQNAYGVMENGIITFNEGIIHAFDGNFYMALGSFTLNLPGAKTPSAMNSVECSGTLTDATGNLYALVNFNVNPTTTEVRYSLVEGLDVDVEAVATGIVDGSVEAVSTTEFINVQVKAATPGAYTLVAVTFNEDGDAGDVTAATNSVALRVAGGAEPVRIAEGQYTIAKLVDTSVDKVYEGETARKFKLTQSYLEYEKYYLTDFFGWGASSIYVATLDAETNILSVEPYQYYNVATTFMESLAYSDGTKNYIYMYVGGGEEKKDAWQINVEQQGDEYVMTSFATDAEMGLFKLNGTELADVIYTSDAGFIEAGTTIAAYVEPTVAAAPALRSISFNAIYSPAMISLK